MLCYIAGYASSDLVFDLHSNLSFNLHSDLACNLHSNLHFKPVFPETQYLLNPTNFSFKYPLIMETYINQLLEDIEASKKNAPRPYIPPQGVDLWDLPTPEVEERSARVRELEELTGISKDYGLSLQEISRYCSASDFLFWFF